MFLSLTFSPSSFNSFGLYERSSEISNFETFDLIDANEIMENVRAFVSFGSRVTSYLGCDKAAEFISNRFVEYGLENVSYESFNVAIPVDYGDNITFLSSGEVFPAYTLASNLIETCALSLND